MAKITSIWHLLSERGPAIGLELTNGNRYTWRKDAEGRFRLEAAGTNRRKYCTDSRLCLMALNAFRGFIDGDEPGTISYEGGGSVLRYPVPSHRLEPPAGGPEGRKFEKLNHLIDCANNFVPL